MNPIHPEFEVKGIVCPNCLTNYPGAERIPIVEADGVRYRTYLGGCMKVSCLMGFEVTQIQIDGKWYIHRYQLYKTQPYGPEVVVVPLQAGTAEIPPAPTAAEPTPLVLVGPGGEYQRAIAVSTDGIRKTFHKILSDLGQTFETLLSQVVNHEPNR